MIQMTHHRTQHQEGPNQSTHWTCSAHQRGQCQCADPRDGAHQRGQCHPAHPRGPNQRKDPQGRPDQRPAKMGIINYDSYLPYQ